MKVRVSARARREADRCDAWWRTNRPAAIDLFAQELVQVLELLRVDAGAGTLYEAVPFE